MISATLGDRTRDDALKRSTIGPDSALTFVKIHKIASSAPAYPPADHGRLTNSTAIL